LSRARLYVPKCVYGVRFAPRLQVGDTDMSMERMRLRARTLEFQRTQARATFEMWCG
jgi:hypothetical protein